MSGNVWEWRYDTWDAQSAFRVLRGGRWYYSASFTRSAFRYDSSPHPSGRQRWLPSGAPLVLHHSFEQLEPKCYAPYSARLSGRREERSASVGGTPRAV